MLPLMPSIRQALSELSILCEEVGVEGTTLKWFQSFLQGRTQRVKIGTAFSLESGLIYGVAQGSVLEPVLFTIYIRSLHKHITLTWFDIFGFADDHQLLKSFLPIFQVTALRDDIRHCFEIISKWMNEFFLCLYPGETKILIIVPPSLKGKIIIQGTFINDRCVRLVQSAKNLGVILDNELSFEPQINSVVKSCFNVMRKLSIIKAYLTYDQL